MARALRPTMSFGRPGRWTSPAEMTVVTPPWSPDSMKSIVRWRGVKSPNTGWAWESMSPGIAVVPWASMTRSAVAPPAAARRRPPAVGHGQGQQQLVARRGVGHADRDRVEMAPDEHRLDVVDGDVEGRPHSGALLDRGQDRDPARAVAGRRPELGVEDGGDVLQLARLADDAALAVRFDGRAERLLAAPHELVAEDLAEIDELAEGVG